MTVIQNVKRTKCIHVYGLVDRRPASKINFFFTPISRLDNGTDRWKTARCKSRNLGSTGQLEKCPNTLRNPRSWPTKEVFQKRTNSVKKQPFPMQNTLFPSLGILNLYVHGVYVIHVFRLRINVFLTSIPFCLSVLLLWLGSQCSATNFSYPR